MKALDSSSCMAGTEQPGPKPVSVAGNHSIPGPFHLALLWRRQWAPTAMGFCLALPCPTISVRTPGPGPMSRSPTATPSASISIRLLLLPHSPLHICHSLSDIYKLSPPPICTAARKSGSAHLLDAPPWRCRVPPTHTLA